MDVKLKQRFFLSALKARFHALKRDRIPIVRFISDSRCRRFRCVVVASLFLGLPRRAEFQREEVFAAFARLLPDADLVVLAFDFDRAGPLGCFGVV